MTSISHTSSPNSRRNLPDYTGQARLQLNLEPSICHYTQPGKAFWKLNLSRVLAQVTVNDKTVYYDHYHSLELKVRVSQSGLSNIKSNLIGSYGLKVNLGLTVIHHRKQLILITIAKTFMEVIMRAYLIKYQLGTCTLLWTTTVIMDWCPC